MQILFGKVFPYDFKCITQCLDSSVYEDQPSSQTSINRWSNRLIQTTEDRDRLLRSELHSTALSTYRRFINQVHQIAEQPWTVRPSNRPRLGIFRTI